LLLPLLMLMGMPPYREALIGLTAWHEETQQQAALQALLQTCKSAIN
jgi:hypothetical protein